MLWLWNVSRTPQQSAETADPKTSSRRATARQNGSSGLEVRPADSGSAIQSDNLLAPSNDQTTAPNRHQVEPTEAEPADKNNQTTLDPRQFGAYEQYKDQPSALYADIKTGSGAAAKPGDEISVAYRGWLTDGTLFDENDGGEQPFSFTLGAGQVIPGWEQAIAGMQVGGERLLIIPPSVGYGPSGSGPIPPNAVLVFRVKVVGLD
ncbi:peptidylprolyl isomerase [Candidatus Saccharibacteria bacterium]|nr:MAG: peptidylprolyl isomerase [Candidatus Saccharibacteria bacterium]